MKRHLPPEVEATLVSMLETIMRCHVGKEKVIKRDALLAELLRYEKMLDDRAMRRLIEKHLPHICGSPKGGYYLAKDSNEAREVAVTLEHYIRGLAKKRAAIIRANPDSGQLTLGI
jgi:hypothetical protein